MGALEARADDVRWVFWVDTGDPEVGVAPGVEGVATRELGEPAGVPGDDAATEL